MKVIVDANIIFSGILNTNGKIGDLLINSDKQLNFIAHDFLRVEIRSHYNRIMQISKMQFNEVLEAEFQICKDITFISEEQVSDTNWLSAEKLTATMTRKTHIMLRSQNNFIVKYGRAINNSPKDFLKRVSKTLSQLTNYSDCVKTS